MNNGESIHKSIRTQKIRINHYRPSKKPYPQAGKSIVAKESIWHAESRARPPFPRAASPSLDKKKSDYIIKLLIFLIYSNFRG